MLNHAGKRNRENEAPPDARSILSMAGDTGDEAGRQGRACSGHHFTTSARKFRPQPSKVRRDCKAELPRFHGNVLHAAVEGVSAKSVLSREQ